MYRIVHRHTCIYVYHRLFSAFVGAVFAVVDVVVVAFCVFIQLLFFAASVSR